MQSLRDKNARFLFHPFDLVARNDEATRTPDAAYKQKETRGIRCQVDR